MCNVHARYHICGVLAICTWPFNQGNTFLGMMRVLFVNGSSNLLVI